MKLVLRTMLALIAGLLVTGSLVGCGQVSVFGHTIGESHPAEVKADSTATSVITAIPPVRRVKAVTLALNPQVAARVVDDPRFSADALLTAIKNELQVRKVLDPDSQGSQVNTTAEISIDDYAMRPTSNVILFGNIISVGVLKGDLHVRDEHNNDLPPHRIESELRVSIPANGEVTDPLGPLSPLYRRFAVMIGDALTGTVTKPASEIQPPR